MKCLEMTFSTFLQHSASWIATLFKKSGLCNIAKDEGNNPPPPTRSDVYLTLGDNNFTGQQAEGTTKRHL